MPEDVEDEEAGLTDDEVMEVERETAAGSASGPDPSGKGKLKKKKNRIEGKIKEDNHRFKSKSFM
jgi:hypothetical protein